MTTERWVTDDGVVVESQIQSDEFRELAVARVVSLSPPQVQLEGRRDPTLIAARLEGLTVQVGDRILLCRVEQGVVAIGIVEVL